MANAVAQFRASVVDSLPVGAMAVSERTSPVASVVARKSIPGSSGRKCDRWRATWRIPDASASCTEFPSLTLTGWVVVEAVAVDGCDGGKPTRTFTVLR